MKVLLYSEGLKAISKSGLGKAIKHQMKALEYENIPYTLNPKDDYDILHINTYFPKSYFLAKKARKQGKKVVIVLKKTLKMVLSFVSKYLHYLKNGLLSAINLEMY